jgi:hypothetical protein
MHTPCFIVIFYIYNVTKIYGINSTNKQQIKRHNKMQVQRKRDKKFMVLEAAVPCPLVGTLEMPPVSPAS